MMLGHMDFILVPNILYNAEMKWDPGLVDL